MLQFNVSIILVFLNNEIRCFQLYCFTKKHHAHLGRRYYLEKNSHVDEKVARRYLSGSKGIQARAFSESEATPPPREDATVGATSHHASLMPDFRTD